MAHSVYFWLCMIWWQAHGLDAETLAKREVVRIDIANDPVRQSVSIFWLCILTMAKWVIKKLELSKH